VSLTVSQRARLGVFIIAGLCCIALFIAIPVGFNLTNKKNSYYCLFTGESLTGLEKGAMVKFRGVTVGSVSNISYDPDNLSQVRVTLLLDNSFPVKTDMVAVLGGINITGIKHLELQGGTDSAPTLSPGSEIETKVSVMTEITGQAEELLAKAELLIQNFITLTHPDSLSDIKQTITNISMISDQINTFMAASGPTVEQMSNQMTSILASTDQIASNLSRISSVADSAIGTGAIARSITNFDSSAASIAELSEQLSLLLRQGREDISISLINIREATENANELTKILAENPSLLLRQDQQRERNFR